MLNAYPYKVENPHNVSLYGLDFLSDYFASERVLLKIFDNAIRFNNYSKLDIIVSAIYKYLCDIIDTSDSVSIINNNTDHFTLDNENKVRIKKDIKFNLSYDRENPIVFKNYDSKYLSKDVNNDCIYLFYLNNKELIEFHSNVCLFFDYRPKDLIIEHHKKYKDIIDFNVFEKD